MRLCCGAALLFGVCVAIGGYGIKKQLFVLSARNYGLNKTQSLLHYAPSNDKKQRLKDPKQQKTKRQQTCIEHIR